MATYESGSTSSSLTISVVIPVYNRAKPLADAIQSVLDQTVPATEIIVVDDGSDDDPLAVVDNFRDPRIRLLRQENAGGGAARNAGIEAASGTHIAFLDSDDRFMPRHLEAAVEILRREPSAVVYGVVLLDRGSGVTLTKPPRGIGPAEPMGEYLLCDRGWVQTSTICLPATLARKVRFNQQIRYGQDTDFALRLAEVTSQFRFVPEPTVLYDDRHNPSRLSVAKRADHLEAWLESMRGRLSNKAYHGFRGWHLASSKARTRSRTGLTYFASSVLRGCYGPKLAATIFLQIVLSPSLYRSIADTIVLRRSRK